MLESALAEREARPLDVYRMLEAYYFNNGLYEVVQQALYENGIWTPGMKALRNPARRAVEFHVTHIWPGALEKALPLVTENARIVKPLQQVWKWSNWAVKKQLAARWFALYGDWFCKAATFSSGGKVERVFLQNIKPELVTDFEVDERGVVTWLRLDVPGADGLTHTEVWSVLNGFQVYRHRLGAGTGVSQLGKPLVNRELSEFGIDFVPFVHASFTDMGEKRGLGVFSLALDKIDEANRMATRLHQLIFRYNKPTVALMANAVDAAGRPLPAPRLNGASAGLPEVAKDEDVLSFPGTSRMEYLVAPLNYSAHLEAVNAQMRELEEDLPELTYYRQKDLSASASGRALRLMLSQAADRTLEARGNLESALARADCMALTMGVNADLFKDIGSYEAGDFEHGFAEREVIPYSMEEQAAALGAEVAAGVPLAVAARRQGWSEAEVRALSPGAASEALSV